MKLLSLIIILFFGLTACENFNFAESHEGKVTKVVDGDTLKLHQKNKEITIRLAEIDAPEYGQPFWKKSKQALEKHVAGKRVKVEEFDRDQYGRIVGHIYIDDFWVNGDLVEQGYAYVYERYAVSNKLYKLEAHAEKNKRGIWKLSEKERVKPWVWRENNK